MSQRITQAELAADVIDGLEDPTPGAIERATSEFPARSVASAGAARAAAGGGGNGGSQPESTLIAPGTEIGTHQDDNWGNVPAFQNALGPTLTPGQGIVISGLSGLGESPWVELRLFDEDGKLIDAVGQGLTNLQVWALMANGEGDFVESGQGAIQSEGSPVASAFLAIYATGYQEQTSDPYTVGAAGIEYKVISSAEAAALAAALWPV